MTPYSVTDLTLYLKQLLETNSVLRNTSVTGEVSNLTYNAQSGHVYFSLKDKDAQISCTMFRAVAIDAPKIVHGEKIIVTGNVEIYPPSGRYQLNVKALQKTGLGDLYQQFVALKERLQKEGLFEAKHKKPIPKVPHKICVLTSPTGAAIQDILNTLRNRFPPVKVTLIPTIVQGEQGKVSIIQSLVKAEKLGADTIILGRGGGSIEDLWNFNEEMVVRAIFACNIPIITGIGHESDYTIADFVADFRAETPTAAAVKAVPDKKTILNYLNDQSQKVTQSIRYLIHIKQQILDNYHTQLQQSLLQGVQQKQHEVAKLQVQLRQILPQKIQTFRFELSKMEADLQQILPQKIQTFHFELSKMEMNLQKNMLSAIQDKKHILKNLQQQLGAEMENALQNRRHTLQMLDTQLQAFHQSHTQILEKGYSLTLKEGKIVASEKDLQAGDVIETVLKDGRVKSVVS